MGDAAQNRWGVRHVKAHLSELLQEVRQGSEIVITDRGRPVGKLVPIQPGDLSQDERLADLVARGIIHSPRQPGSVQLPPPLVLAEEGIAQRFLREDRDQGY